jgi:hypothetical protein
MKIVKATIYMETMCYKKSNSEIKVTSPELNYGE